MDPREQQHREDQHRAAPNTLLAAPPRVINVGLELFAENLASHGAAVMHVRWSPPAGGNAQLADLLAKLRG
jgi:FdrA protein